MAAIQSVLGYNSQLLPIPTLASTSTHLTTEHSYLVDVPPHLIIYPNADLWCTLT